MWACCQQSRWPWALACQETIRFISVSNRGSVSICKRGTNSPCRARGRCPLDSGGLTFPSRAWFPQSCKFRAQRGGATSGESEEERKGLWKWTRKQHFSLARGRRGPGLCGWQILDSPGACFPLLLSKPPWRTSRPTTGRPRSSFLHWRSAFTLNLSSLALPGATGTGR